MRIGAYEVLDEIGRGAFGRVFRARAPDGGVVAIKALIEERATQGGARFEREARIGSTLGEEQGFVPIVDEGSSPEVGRYIVMPFLAGGTLRDRLGSGTLTVHEAWKLGLELARSLGEAHARGIVHRDLKPENVLFTAYGCPLVADLGLAKRFLHGPVADGKSLALTRAGEIYGTAAYMPCEQLRDARAAGPPADVFALGCVLYETLAGRTPFGGTTIIEVVSSIDAGRFEPIRAARPDVPPALEAAIGRALARAPEDRFEDGAAFARALEAISVTAPRRSGRRVALAVLALAGLAAAAGAYAFEVKARRHAEARELLARGRELEGRGEHEGAIRELTRAVELDPGLAAAWSARAASRGAGQDASGELEDASRAIELDEHDAGARACRAHAHWLRGDTEAAITDATRAIELDPGLALAWGVRARALRGRGRLADAARDATKAIDLGTREPGAFVIRGEALMRDGDLDGSLAAARRALELAPRDLDALDLLARAAGHVGRLDEALDAANRMIEVAPRDARGLAMRGDIRWAKLDPTGALEDASGAIALDPRSGIALGVRARARIGSGDMKGAIADATAALAADPKIPAALEARGEARLQTGDLDGAIEDTTAAIALVPKEAYPWHTRADARRQKRDFDGALDDVSRAIELDPNYSSAYVLRAILHLESKPDAALADAAHAIAINRRATPEAWYIRGRAHQKLGNAAAALADYEHFVQTWPQNGNAKDARARIAALRAGR